MNISTYSSEHIINCWKVKMANTATESIVFFIIAVSKLSRCKDINVVVGTMPGYFQIRVSSLCS